MVSNRSVGSWPSVTAPQCGFVTPGKVSLQGEKVVSTEVGTLGILDRLMCGSFHLGFSR